MQGLGRGSVFREATKKEISRVLADEGNWDNEEVYKKSKKKKEDSYRQQQERLDALVIGDATVEVEKCDNDDKDTTKADEKTKKDRKDIPGSFPRN